MENYVYEIITNEQRVDNLWWRKRTHKKFEDKNAWWKCLKKAFQ